MEKTLYSTCIQHGMSQFLIVSAVSCMLETNSSLLGRSLGSCTTPPPPPPPENFNSVCTYLKFRLYNYLHITNIYVAQEFQAHITP